MIPHTSATHSCPGINGRVAILLPTKRETLMFSFELSRFRPSMLKISGFSLQCKIVHFSSCHLAKFLNDLKTKT